MTMTTEVFSRLKGGNWFVGFFSFVLFNVDGICYERRDGRTVTWETMEETDVPDAGVRAGEVLAHVVGVAAVVVEDDAVEL